jgi:hypothetical protein
MEHEKIRKYRPYPPVRLKDRTWPDQMITRAPVWCSVDLRDGNQALIQPMNLEEKLEMFQLLVQVGFKEIEVGFPSASQIEYDFSALLIDGNHIPDGVVPQVLTQAQRAADQEIVRLAQGGPRGHCPSLQFHLDPAARCGVQERPQGNHRVGRGRGAAHPGTGRGHRSHGSAMNIRRRASPARNWICPGDLRGDHGCLGADPGKSGDHQSAGHGGDVDPEHLCRSDRVVLPPHEKSRLRPDQPPCP